MFLKLPRIRSRVISATHRAQLWEQPAAPKGLPGPTGALCSDTSLSCHCKLPEPASFKPLLSVWGKPAIHVRMHRWAADPFSQNFDNCKSQKVWGAVFFQVANWRVDYFFMCVLAAEVHGRSSVRLFCFPLLHTHFSLQNCFIWDACLGQAAGVRCYIHLLTNEYDIRVTSIFYKYLLPIWFTRQHRPRLKTEGDWILCLPFKAGGISPLYGKNFSLTYFTSIYHCKP